MRTPFLTGSAVEEPSPGIFTFDAVKPSFCKAIAEEVVDYKAWARKSGLSLTGPNSMNKYGLALSRIGLEGWARELAQMYVQPLAHSLGYGTFTDVYGFVVEYSPGKQRALSPHYDAPSALTLNVSLNDDYEGGNLVFYGRRCTRHAGTQSGSRLEVEYETGHKVGRGLIHLGRHMHRARAMWGKRLNLILWCSAPRLTRKHPTWCGWGKS